MDATFTRTRWERSSVNAPDLRPATNATITAFAVFGISLSATALQHATGWRWALLFAALSGLIAFVLIFLALLARQSQLGVREFTVETPVSPDGEPARLMVADAARPKTIRTAGYDISPGGMIRLARELQRANWRFNRDTVRNARALPKEAIDDWPEVLRRFQNAGIVDDERKVTATGQALFVESIPPAPAPFNGSRDGSPFSPPEWRQGENENEDRSRGV